MFSYCFSTSSRIRISVSANNKQCRDCLQVPHFRTLHFSGNDQQSSIHASPQQLISGCPGAARTNWIMSRGWGDELQTVSGAFNKLCSHKCSSRPSLRLNWRFIGSFVFMSWVVGHNQAVSRSARRFLLDLLSASASQRSNKKHRIYGSTLWKLVYKNMESLGRSRCWCLVHTYKRPSGYYVSHEGSFIVFMANWGLIPELFYSTNKWVFTTCI